MLRMCHHKEHCRQQTCPLWLGVEASTRPPGGSSVGRSSGPWGSVPSEWVPPPGVPGHAPGKWCLGAGCFLVAPSQSAATGLRGQSLVERWVSHEIVAAAKTLVILNLQLLHPQQLFVSVGGPHIVCLHSSTVEHLFLQARHFVFGDTWILLIYCYLIKLHHVN